jgi:hypothetical protein
VLGQNVAWATVVNRIVDLLSANLLLDQAMPATWRSVAAARFKADWPPGNAPTIFSCLMSAHNLLPHHFLKGFSIGHSRKVAKGSNVIEPEKPQVATVRQRLEGTKWIGARG